MKLPAPNAFPSPEEAQAITRRDMLLKGGGAFGGLALSFLLGQDDFARKLLAKESHTGEQAASPAMGDSPLAPKPTHFPAKAKNVIFLFMEGGPSHIDLFDPKPALEKLHGKPQPESFGKVLLAMGEQNAPIMASPRKWKRHGKGGVWVSDWLPEIATCADDISVIRSCWSNGLNHAGGVCQMVTGSTLAGRPSLGSWVTYGLGTENQSLPAFVVMNTGGRTPVNGVRNWGTGFMPALYQGTPFQSGPTPIRDLETPSMISAEQQEAKLTFLDQLNREHQISREAQTELDARIRSYELAFRMQAEAPEAVELSEETEKTKQLYGMDQKATAEFGQQCLLARRLVERGVRFVQLFHGAGSRWDSHSGLEKRHAELCQSMDKPVAGLLKDLKQRGLLDETLVVWGGEFGRTPMSEKGDGRDHNPYGFTMFMAGAGIQGGRMLGATDEIGLHAIEDRLHVHDFHATILHLLGLDHMRVVYNHKGRPERPTLNEGEAYHKIVG
ncbi:Secreted protein containing DUF1501 [Planctomycetales bacterium 10988]|nr:Secreted protein containing DUF1501 [Planctomycetales bacterium 10988]